LPCTFHTGRSTALARDRGRDEGGVLAHADQQGGLALAEEVDAGEVEAGDHGAGTLVVDREAEVVERLGPPHPAAVVGAEPAREHDHPELAQREPLGRAGVERLGLRNGRRVQGPFPDELADQVHELAVALVPPGDALGQVGREANFGVGRAEEVAAQRDPFGPQRPQVQVVAAAVTGREDVGEQPGGRRGQRADRGVHEAGLHDPPEDVPAPQPSGRPRRPAAGQDHLAAGLVQLLDDLGARLAAAHHQHPARRQ
jgi:hypothetical protein